MNLACFISAHGFGHAARTSAVISEIAGRNSKHCFTLFSAVPAWFFADISGIGEILCENVDIGLVQHDAIHVDIPATEAWLSAQLPFDQGAIDRLAGELIKREIDAVLCDIAPLGIAAARAAGIPSILLENFTWDFIYAGLGDDRLAGPADYLGAWFERASWHIQTEPLCRTNNRDLLVGPISRKPRSKRSLIRSALGLSDTDMMVLCSLGGNPQDLPGLDHVVRERPDIRFVVAGASDASSQSNVISLAHQNDFDHPSLVAASDVVIGKLGYSTIAEVYQAGVPFGAFTRPGYPEMPALENFSETNLNARIFSMDQFLSGGWINAMDDLLSLPVTAAATRPDSSAAQVADFICERIGS